MCVFLDIEKKHKSECGIEGAISCVSEKLKSVIVWYIEMTTF